MQNVAKLIAEKIKAVRLATGLTQKEFGKKIGYSEGTIAAYERGARKPTIDVIEAIIDKFDFSVEFFLGTIPGSDEMDEKRLEMIRNILVLIQLMPDADLEKILKHIKIEAKQS